MVLVKPERVPRWERKGRSMTAVIRGTAFTKSHLRKTVKVLLKSAPKRLSRQDEEFMNEVFWLHSKATEKMRDAIFIGTRKNPVFRTKEFFVQTEAGPRDISFNRCITPKHANTDRLSACRQAVEPDIRRYRDAYFDGRNIAPCEATGVSIERKKSHVDHENPLFRTIVDEFFATADKTMNVELKAVSSLTDTGTREFQSDGTRDAFIEFHNHRAKLRVVSASFNLTRPKLQRNIV